MARRSVAQQGELEAAGLFTRWRLPVPKVGAAERARRRLRGGTARFHQVATESRFKNAAGAHSVHSDTALPGYPRQAEPRRDPPATIRGIQECKTAGWRPAPAARSRQRGSPALIYAPAGRHGRAPSSQQTVTAVRPGTSGGARPRAERGGRRERRETGRRQPGGHGGPTQPPWGTTGVQRPIQATPPRDAGRTARPADHQEAGSSRTRT